MLIAGLAALATGLTAVATVPAAHAADPAGQGVVISEVFGGGGNSGATLKQDFIELYNPTGTAVSVDGWSVQYRSATGTTAQVTALSGSVPARGHYLVQQAAGTGGTQDLPTPDATGSIPMSGSAGVVLLTSSTTPFTATGDLAGSTAVVDAVGYGSTPTTYETARTGVNLTSTTSAQRAAAGTDTDHNANDFEEAAPTPTSSQTGGDPEPEPAPEVVTIAQVQGTGDASPLVGRTVTTRGVVTANYPSGGFNGFYIQTAGTGAGEDATPGASDGLFVYGAAVDESTLAIGDHVQVTGEVGEYTQGGGGRTSSLTQLRPAAAGDVIVLAEPAVAPKPLVTTWFATDAEREAHEGELVELTGPLTVTNSYNTHQYGEVGLAVGTTPLVQPTEVEDAQTGDVAGVAADNERRLVTLDDGRSVNFAGSASGTPMSWLTADRTVRTGAAATLLAPVVVDHRNGLYKVQPTSPVEGAGADVAAFEDTRTDAPAEVGGDIRLATFNVLNYFPTTGAEYVASGGSCSYYTDRAGNPVTTRDCGPTGPRGAANEENLARQQAKIVAAINRLDASIVGLEEIENSAKYGKDRDFAVARLVEALNADAGAGTWDYVPSPAQRPDVSLEDVIRTAFIYRPDDVVPVGESAILEDEVNFDNAREPLAQAFTAADGEEDPEGTDAFAVIVNHFKSKGSGVDDGTGQGLANPDRIGQAQALRDFADTFAAQRGTEAVFLTGDFNAYTMEDPMQVLYEAGYEAVESSTPGEETYVFGGLVGSLDHVLANEAAAAMVTGADVWNINAVEPVGYEYSRYNANVTDLYAAGPFRSSDHDPEVVGLDLDGETEPGEPAGDLRVKVTPRRVWEDRTRPKVHVRVADSEEPGTGEVAVAVDGEQVGTCELRGGACRVRLIAFEEAGDHTVTVTWPGDGSAAAVSESVVVTVHEVRGKGGKDKGDQTKGGKNKKDKKNRKR
ncbi:ExeM/NucH family extracellular endonuclease [Nocardioides sp. GCM10027113]|uniref:ExeM/NucH family extracellular endonuclease n=1 Tax=unclassified Nocardioides TaxID=2615069 RepID=UPI00360C5837